MAYVNGSGCMRAYSKQIWWVANLMMTSNIIEIKQIVKLLIEKSKYMTDGKDLSHVRI